ncbi:hypothetical protein BO226_19170 [Rhodococcus sp. 2G]|nr:hypothetical protein BO226_19170 [Rhodococcus sp. 2G]
MLLADRYRDGARGEVRLRFRHPHHDLVDTIDRRIELVPSSIRRRPVGESGFDDGCGRHCLHLWFSYVFDDNDLPVSATAAGGARVSAGASAASSAWELAVVASAREECS